MAESAPACPVAALAREAARLVAARRANDEASLKARPGSDEHERLAWEADLILDRLPPVDEAPLAVAQAAT